MNNNSNKILAFILSIIIMMFSLLFIFNKKIDFSENENRYLQEIPKFRLFKILRIILQIIFLLEIGLLGLRQRVISC